MHADLRTFLGRVRQRQRRQRVIAAAAAGLLITAGLLALAGLVRTQVAAPGIVLWAVVAVAGPLVGALTGALWPLSWQAAAVQTDRRFGLKGRTVTALEFSSRNRPLGPWEQLQIADAVQQLSTRCSDDVIPRRVPSVVRWAAAATILAAVSWLPAGTPSRSPEGSHRYAVPPRRTGIVTAAREVSEQLAALQRQSSSLPEAADLSDVIEELQRDLQALRERPEEIREALATLSAMQDRIAKRQSEFHLAGTESQLRSLAEALAEAAPWQDVADELRTGQFDKAAESFDQLDPQSPAPREQQDVARRLDELAEAMEGNVPQELNDAVRSLSENLRTQDAAAASRDFGELADSVRQHQRMQEASRLLEEQRERLAAMKPVVTESEQTVSVSEAGTPPRTSDASATASGNTPGTAEGTDAPGDSARPESQLQLVELAGQLGSDGPSQRESVPLPDESAVAHRTAQDVLENYRRQSDAVIEDEPIPLAHRQHIRRYFELIRTESGR